MPIFAFHDFGVPTHPRNITQLGSIVWASNYFASPQILAYPGPVELLASNTLIPVVTDLRKLYSPTVSPNGQGNRRRTVCERSHDLALVFREPASPGPIANRRRKRRNGEVKTSRSRMASPIPHIDAL